MGNGIALTEKLQKEILELPQETLPELEKFIEYLRFKARPRKKKATIEPPLDPTDAIRLDGLLKGYDFSPEFIKEARQEMWHKFAVEDE